MPRSIRCGVLGLIAVLVLAALAYAVPAEQEVKEKSPSAKARETLDVSFTLPEGFPQGTTLSEALRYLSERNSVTILFDEEAFKKDLQIQEPTIQPVKLPPLVQVKLSTVLQLTLDQVDGGYFVQDGLVRVVPRQRAATAWRIVEQRIHADFDKKGLKEALEELADRSGANIALDPRVGELAFKRVTASFQGVSVQTAVNLLANMADLKPVLLDNVLYVTTRANASSLQGEREPPKEKMPKVEE